MSHFHLNSTRTRERSPNYDTYYSRPLVRRDSKHQRNITLSDNEDNGHDDYPYSTSHRPVKLSRALTVRSPATQLERYNIWSDGREKHTDDEDERRHSFERRKTYKYTSDRHHDDGLYDPEERNFRLQVQATFGRPKSSHHHHHDSTSIWPTSALPRREKWVDEDWETRERSVSSERRRRHSFWGDEEESKDEAKETWSRFHRIKATKTEEVRPLSGWRRNRIVYGS